MLACLYEQARNPEAFDIQTGNFLWGLPDGGEIYTQYAFSPDGRWLGALAHRWVYGEEELSSLELWDTSTRQLYKSLPFSEDIPLTSLAFSPDSRLAAVGQADGKIFLVDLSIFEVVAMLTGHPGSVETLAFSPDGLYLASGGMDGTVRLWGVP